MFCFQCEQTSKGTGCTDRSVCGKDETTAGLQDLLVYATKGISNYAWRAGQNGLNDPEVDKFVMEALFTTVTNVNFDPERLVEILNVAFQMQKKAKDLYLASCEKTGSAPETLSGPAAWVPAGDLDGLNSQADACSITGQKKKFGEDISGLMELVMYGLKGAAAYAEHALVLGMVDPQLSLAFHEGLDFLSREDLTVDELVGWAMKAGEINLKVMELLDKANTETYGHPEPTEILVTPVKGKAILVSGHDLKDLELLLKQSEGKGVNVYTHGEMLPCLAYPGMKKYSHLVGNYGGAWQDQQKEFAQFPGAILMTTNCIQEPGDLYMDKIYTTGMVAWPGVKHVGDDKDFSPVIEAALADEGFLEDAPEQKIVIGFGHNTVLGVADKVIEAVKSGDIKHFFLVGGCDGAKPGRNYYSDFADAVPDDCMILTLACGKFRFNKRDFGAIGGIPRLLDMGQCNDAYSAIKVATALAGAFECGVNDLPLSLILSWYEQKAVAILLTLLHLDIKNIRIGPSLPAFITKPVLDVLVEKFNLAPVTTPENDLKAIFGK